MSATVCVHKDVAQIWVVPSAIQSPTRHAQTSVNDAIGHDVSAIYGTIGQFMGSPKDVKVVLASVVTNSEIWPKIKYWIYSEIDYESNTG